MSDIRLFSYKMTHDTGFAPNPFHGILTLANCKPCIRKYKKVGDWIAGFTSKKLNGDNTGEERLVYLMKVEEKITYDKYFLDYRFADKIPDYSKGIVACKAGDNIYQPTTNGGFRQLQSMHSNGDQENPEKKKHDLSGKYVLISKCFYYFGSSPIKIDKKIRPSIPKGQSAHGVRTHEIEKAEKFIQHIQNKYQVGTVNTPHIWPDEIIIDQKDSTKCK